MVDVIVVFGIRRRIDDSDPIIDRRPGDVATGRARGPGPRRRDVVFSDLLNAVQEVSRRDAVDSFRDPATDSVVVIRDDMACGGCSPQPVLGIVLFGLQR